MTEYPVIGGKADNTTFKCATKKAPLSLRLKGDSYLLFRWPFDPANPRSREISGYIWCGMKIVDGIAKWRERNNGNRGLRKT